MQSNGVLAIRAHKHAGKHMVNVSSCCFIVFEFESPFLKPSWILYIEFIELQSRNFISDYER